MATVFIGRRPGIEDELNQVVEQKQKPEIKSTISIQQDRARVLDELNQVDEQKQKPEIKSTISIQQSRDQILAKFKSTNESFDDSWILLEW